jgi:RNA polymerase sigma-70 factor (ECF subfamily)
VSTPAPEAPDDAALLAQSAAGNGRAFAVLVRRHGPALQRFARRLVPEASLADDVLQQALLDAYRGAATFRGEARVRTWLFTLTRHAAFRATRRQREIPEDDEELLALGVSAGWGADPETLTIRARQAERLEAALESLAPADREVVLLRDVEQLTGPETAAVLGMGLAAMKSRLHRARLRLAVALREGEEGEHHA